VKAQLSLAGLAGATVLLLMPLFPAAATPSSQAETALAVDADPSGNTATTLGPIDPCVSVDTGDFFSIDLVVNDVEDLIAWQVRFVYDPEMIDLIERDVKLFLAASEGSSVFDFSEGPPDDGDGINLMAAADTADPASPDSGSGVLARVNLRALKAGTSPAGLPKIDMDANGTPDDGPILTEVDARRIGDTDGDSLFDGSVAHAVIAVDQPCENVTPVAFSTPITGSPEPAPTEDQSSSDDNWTTIAVVAAVIAGALAVLGAAGVGLVRWRPR